MSHPPPHPGWSTLWVLCLLPLSAQAGDVFEDQGHYCSDDTFPKVMAFRPFDSGDVIDSDGTTTTTTALTTDTSFACVEYLHEQDPVSLAEVEAHYDTEVTTIWHGSWATITPNRVAIVGSCSGGTPAVSCVWDGHWLFEVGTILTSDPDSATGRLYVEDSSVFDEGKYAMLHAYHEDVPSGTGTHDCEGTKSGWSVTHDWDTAEHFKVTRVCPGGSGCSSGTYIEIDTDDGTAGDQFLTGSWSISGDDGLWVAPHTLTWRDQAKSWAINVSNISPSYSDATYGDMPGWKYYARYVYDHEWQVRINKDGDGDPLTDDRPDGIEFDGGRWRADKLSANYHVDSDNDLCEDDGYIEGLPEYGLGGARFAGELRSIFTLAEEDIILQADSSIPSWGFRGYQHLDGIEMENYHEAIGDETVFSSAFLHLRQWTERAHYEQFSYGFTKDATELYGCGALEACDGVDNDSDGTIDEGCDYGYNEDLRVGLASDLLMGQPHPYAAESNGGTQCFGLYRWDEYNGGDDLLDWDWLGDPDPSDPEPLQITDHLDTTTDHLVGASWGWVRNYCSGGFTGGVGIGLPFTLDGDTLCNGLEQVPDVEDAEIFANGFTVLSGPSDTSFTTRFTVAADNAYDYTPDYDSFTAEVPRLLRVKLHYRWYTLPLGGGPPTEHTDTLSQDVLVPADGAFYDYDLSFVLPGNVELYMVSFHSAEEPGTLTLEETSLYRGSVERWVRYFGGAGAADGGAVLLNMTETPWTFSLKLWPTGWERLDGPQDAAYGDVNDGTAGSGMMLNTFTVEPFDALLVRRRELIEF